MPVKLYNTLTNRVEELITNEDGKVKFYTCGPTVYDYNHIGNFRSYIFEDLLKRYLLYKGYQVIHIMNITDIDDKTIKKSNLNKVPLEELTAKYTKAFFEDIKKLNILPADNYPKATEHLPEMLKMVKKLMDKGYAYKKDGSIYFSIKKFKDYGKLANIKPENLKIGTSVDLDEYNKENARDFVLWKGKKENEPSWEFELGAGRPGWHLECSAMSMKYLGESFDLHAGGVDNIFPHHENEIAQSEAVTGKKFVNHWVHCQHLIADNMKMSKSLGNFYTLRDILKKGYDAMVVRYLLISTHYRKLLNFTFPELDSAKRSLERINNFVFTIFNMKVLAGVDPKISKTIQKKEAKFQEQLDDDLNISGGLGVFFDFIHEINLKKDLIKQENIGEIKAYLKRVNSIFGFIKLEEDTSIDKEIEELINKRNEARENKDFQTADKIRDDLKAQGIILIDTPKGTQWKKS